MPLTLVAVSSSNTRRQKTIKIKAIPVGNYVAGGVPLDLTTITDPTFQGSCFPGSVPGLVEVESTPVGFTSEIVAGTDPTTLATAYKLKIYSVAGTEMAAAAFSAALLADSFLLSLVGPNWGF